MPETPAIIIWRRRAGRAGYRWRADFPPGNGVDSGYVDSSSRETVEQMAAVVAEKFGYEVVHDLPGGES